MGRTYRGKYNGPNNFQSFSGESTFFKVEETTSPFLYALAQKFPVAFSRALKSVGNTLRVEMRSAMSQGGAAGTSWPKRSLMHIYRRMDLLKAGGTDNEGNWVHGKRFYLKKQKSGITYQLSDRALQSVNAGERGGFSFFKGKRRGRTYSGSGKLRGEQSIPNAFSRWKGKNDLRGGTSMGGLLFNAIRYKMVNKNRVDIGAITPSAAKHLEAVQAGKRGSKGIFQFTGTQTVTPAMRRAFWAAGIPLSKNTKTLTQEPRPLVAPVYQQFSPSLESHIVGKIVEWLDIQAGSTYQKSPKMTQGTLWNR